jgi:DNA modification methylase
MKPYYDDETSGITIYHGDCREVLPHLPPLDLIVTDPPYGVGIDYASYDDDLAATTAMVLDFVKLATSKAKAVAFTVGKWDTELALYQQMPPRWRMCWYKGAQSTASPIGFNDWETVMIYGADVHRHAHDYFFAQPEKMGAFGHPCPKPLAYATTLIKRLARPGDLVCDPFMGSGTTLRAAKDLAHKAIGIEKEERYCEIAANRLSQGVLFGGAA